MKLERRVTPIAPELRQGDGEVTITGLAAVFNQKSRNLGGFVELIQPGFFRSVLAGDTFSLFNHDGNFVLGRTTAETLSLSESDQGLETVTTAANSARNRDWVFTPMGRGEIRQMSFAFFVNRGGDRWEEQIDGTMFRTLLPGGCERLNDISVVSSDAAYPQTDAALRSLREHTGEAKAAKLLERSRRILLRARAITLKGLTP